MKKYIKASKESSNGVFWYLDDREELVSYPFGSVDSTEGIAKSGNTYNHKRLWKELDCVGTKKPFNYYPRGRVDWDRLGSATVYLNPNIDENVINQIKVDFGIGPSDQCKVEYDFSNHYKCHLDEGWKPEN